MKKMWSVANQVIVNIDQKEYRGPNRLGQLHWLKLRDTISCADWSQKGTSWIVPVLLRNLMLAYAQQDRALDQAYLGRKK